MTEWKRHAIRQAFGMVRSKRAPGVLEMTLVSSVYLDDEHVQYPHLLLDEMEHHFAQEMKRSRATVEMILTAQSRADYLAKRSVADAARRNGE